MALHLISQKSLMKRDELMIVLFSFYKQMYNPAHERIDCDHQPDRNVLKLTGQATEKY